MLRNGYVDSKALHIDELPGPALLLDPDGSILQANTHAGSLFELEPEAMVGLDFHCLIEEEYREGWVDSLASISGPESRVKFDRVPCATGDGRELTIDIDAGATADGRLAILIRDVSAEQRALADLETGERQLRIGLQHLTDLIQFVDVPRDHVRWHGDFDAVLGYAAGTFPHTLSGWLEFIHPDDRDRIEAEYQAIVGSGSPTWELRYRIRAADGTYRHLLDRGAFVSFVDGAGARGIGGIIDETEQVVARQELESALAEVSKLRDRLQAESRYLQSEIEWTSGFAEIVGSSDALKQALAQVESVSHTNATVLLLGETGTGKELLARAIHRRSARSDRALIKVDCGTLPSGLVESELFGHEKGSFTGAHDRKIGRFELAHGGTILLDEIGELPLDLQAKLLRAIEEGEIRRVGGRADIPVNVRVIAATNRDLRTEVREGRFRADLYYRLNVFPIIAPPLRDRREDISDLVSHFAAKSARHLGKKVARVAESSLNAMVAYEWPGNVRELRNVIERAVILCPGDTLVVDPLQLGESDPALAPTRGSLKDDLHSVERAKILQALKESGWKIKGEGNAASRLGTAPSTLRSRMRTLGITRPGSGRARVLGYRSTPGFLNR
jgi:DNA-binding NtrC family response regulator